ARRPAGRQDLRRRADLVWQLASDGVARLVVDLRDRQGGTFPRERPGHASPDPLPGPGDDRRLPIEPRHALPLSCRSESYAATPTTTALLGTPVPPPTRTSPTPPTPL